MIATLEKQRTDGRRRLTVEVRDRARRTHAVGGRKAKRLAYAAGFRTS
jgi:hypothetical protein